MSHERIVIAALLVGCGQASLHTERHTERAAEPRRAATAPRPATDPPADVAIAAPTHREIGATAEKGLDWLRSHQLPDGGWGQGDESANMAGSQQGLRDASNVADTSMALLAFVRAGSTASQGPDQDAVRKGIELVIGQIEASDDESLYVTSVRGTRVQAKIGAYVDTFASLMILTELRGTMPTEAANRRLQTARSKVLAKLERNQQANGTWNNQGWAPVLSQAMAARGLNQAAQAGDAVQAETIRRVERYAQGQLGPGGSFAADGSAAGVELYSGAASVSGMRHSVTTRRANSEEVRRQAAKAPTAAARDAARREIEESARAERTLDHAEGALMGRLADPSFVQGFGNNGGEEFLSYLFVSEALWARGGEQWTQWNTRISQLVGGVQNEDGSWSGHHCITGRTFCTATALLVLMADRAPAPTAGQLRRG